MSSLFHVLMKFHTTDNFQIFILMFFLHYYHCVCGIHATMGMGAEYFCHRGLWNQLNSSFLWNQNYRQLCYSSDLTSNLLLLEAVSNCLIQKWIQEWLHGKFLHWVWSYTQLLIHSFSTVIVRISVMSQ